MARSGTERSQKGLWLVASASDVGRVRTQNEDSFAVLDSRYLGGAYDLAMIVADGMGGRNAGEIASKSAVEAVTQAILNNAGAVDAPSLLRFAVETAHIAIQQRAEQNPLYEGMGTTLVVALVRGKQLWVAHVGDSRAYILRDDELVALTEDHTFVAEQVRAGGMSLEQARHSRFRHMLTRAVGTNADYTPDVCAIALQPGDAILLCTDGLTGMVSEQEIAHLLRRYRSRPERACQSLIDAANASGGQDNITVVLAVDVGEPDEVYDDGAELQTVADLPTMRDPWRRLEQVARRVPLRYAFVALLVVLVAVATAWWGTRPETKPKPADLPPPSSAVDLASVDYAEPQVLLNKPLRGAPLIVEPQGNLYAMTEQGRVLRISPEGKILSVSDRPFEAATSPDLKPDMVYYAVDAQGNLYVCDRANRRILKFGADGRLLKTIGQGALKRPAAIAVAADGTVYVIDAGRLTALRALPAEVKDASQPHR